MNKKPEPKSPLADKELQRLDKEFNQFNEQVKSLNVDKLNLAPKQEKEEQTKLSQKDLSNIQASYLKPKRSINSREKFNERFRSEYEFFKEYVNFIAENNEIIGEAIEMWTKPYPGLPAEEWVIPVNKPVWAPRYVADQIKRCSYHKLVMQEKVVTSTDGMGEYTGKMVVEETVNRIDARPVQEKTRLFVSSF